MFIYFTGQSGFGNRMMSFVSGLWLCILAKIPKVIIFEEPCRWCPGSVNDVFELPIRMRTVSIDPIQIVTLANTNHGWLTRVDDFFFVFSTKQMTAHSAQHQAITQRIGLDIEKTKTTQFARKRKNVCDLRHRIARNYIFEKHTRHHWW